MAQKIQGPGEEICSSVIQSLFDELRVSGYTDGQILTLAAGLADLATQDNRDAKTPDPFSKCPQYEMPTKMRTLYSGGLDELEDLCNAGLPHKI